MRLLSEQLGNFIDTINQGPAALDPKLFAGPSDRVILGLKAHANTISHARLIALEETFPMTREAMGHETFNALSRSYSETSAARASDNNGIGAGFADFLAARGIAQSLLDLIQIEWLWLESYHAAEAEPFRLEQLAGLDESALLAQPVAQHPAARLVMLQAPLSPQLSELNAAAGTAAVLIARPGSSVLLNPVNHAAAAAFIAADKFSTMGNLLSAAVEQIGDEHSLDAVLALIGAGSLTAGDPVAQ